VKLILACHVRYPDDPHDREWVPVVDDIRWTTISTTRRVPDMVENAKIEAPSKVMQTAVKPLNGSKIIKLFWEQEPQPKDKTPGYIVILHFTEIEVLTGNESRQFYVNLNEELWYEKAYTPPYLEHGGIYSISPIRTASTRYNISLNATANSTRPPIINAVELFSVFATRNLGTNSQDGTYVNIMRYRFKLPYLREYGLIKIIITLPGCDTVSAITAIKDNYNLKKNWMGDPCVPKTLAWDGLTCSYAVSSPPRITGV
jgi:hypothetical protein